MSEEKPNSKNDKNNKDNDSERDMSDKKKKKSKEKLNTESNNNNNQQEQKEITDKKQNSKGKGNSENEKHNKDNGPERDMSDKKKKSKEKLNTESNNNNNQQEQKEITDKQQNSKGKGNSKDEKHNKDDDPERDMSDKKKKSEKKLNTENNTNKNQQEQKEITDKNQNSEGKGNSKDEKHNKRDMSDKKKSEDEDDFDDDGDSDEQEEHIRSASERRHKSSIDKKSRRSIFTIFNSFGQSAEMKEQIILGKYPKSLPFFIFYTFFTTLLQGEEMLIIIYLTEELKYTVKTAIIIYHTKRCLGNTIPIVSAIFADSIFGYFKTIFCLTLISICGCILITLGSIHTLGLPIIKFTLISLAIHACATVSSPIFNAFSGDQFKLPEQIHLLTRFHAIVFLVNNLSELISKTTVPIMRESVHCLGKESCYPLAFGISILYLCFALGVFIIGYSYYNFKTPHKKNMLFLVFQIISYALYKKIKSTDKKKHKHWLNYAKVKYGKHLVGDVNKLRRVLLFCVPLPIYWAVIEQQDSRWTLQGTQMDSIIGNIKIKPEQMHIIGPLLLLFFIPIYDKIFQPILHYIGISTPLQHLLFGGILTITAITISGIIQYNIEKEFPVLPSQDFSVLRIYNGLPLCDYTITTNIPKYKTINVNGLDMITTGSINIEKQDVFDWTLTTTSTVCPTDLSGKFNLRSKQIMSYLIKNNQNSLEIIEYIPQLFMSHKATYIHILTNIKSNDDVIFKSINTEKSYNLKQMLRTEIPSNNYDIYINNNIIKRNIEFKDGGTYTLLVGQESFNYYSKLFTLHSPFYIHILWQIPQYTFLTIGDIMLDIHIMGLSYILAPDSMKAVVQACFLLAAALGEGLIVIFEFWHHTELQAVKYLFYTFLMVANIIIFWLVAKHYNLEDELDEVDEEEALNEYIQI